MDRWLFWESNTVSPVAVVRILSSLTLSHEPWASISKSPSEQQTHLLPCSRDALSPHSMSWPCQHSLLRPPLFSCPLFYLVADSKHLPYIQIFYLHPDFSGAQVSISNISPGMFNGHLQRNSTLFSKPHPTWSSSLRDTTASWLIGKHKPSFCVESSSRYHRQRINQQVMLTMP